MHSDFLVICTVNACELHSKLHQVTCNLHCILLVFESKLLCNIYKLHAICLVICTCLHAICTVICTVIYMVICNSNIYFVYQTFVLFTILTCMWDLMVEQLSSQLMFNGYHLVLFVCVFVCWSNICYCSFVYVHWHFFIMSSALGIILYCLMIL